MPDDPDPEAGAALDLVGEVAGQPAGPHHQHEVGVAPALAQPASIRARMAARMARVTSGWTVNRMTRNRRLTFSCLKMNRRGEGERGHQDRRAEDVRGLRPELPAGPQPVEAHEPERAHPGRGRTGRRPAGSPGRSGPRSRSTRRRRTGRSRRRGRRWWRSPPSASHEAEAERHEVASDHSAGYVPSAGGDELRRWVRRAREWQESMRVAGSGEGRSDRICGWQAPGGRATGIYCVRSSTVTDEPSSPVSATRHRSAFVFRGTAASIRRPTIASRRSCLARSRHVKNRASWRWSIPM